MYPGGKNGAGTPHQIINKIPPHLIYAEGFLGSGAILNNKKPALANYGVEIDRSTIDKFTYMPFAFIVNTDFASWVKQNPQIVSSKDTFIYLDPPYPLSSRKSQRPLYNYEMTDQQHVDLLQLILTMPAMVAISTYENDLYKEALKDWNLYRFQSQTRRGPAVEYLYMNYPDPKQLHDYSFLGNDFTDRQRIKRKIDREIKKLQRLPSLERQAILDSLQLQYSR